MAGGMLKILRALEGKGKWYFYARHVAGVGNILADLITRYKSIAINTDLKRRSRDVHWREWVMGRE